MREELNTEDDGREGLPSASGMEQLVLCPGSWLAQKQVPKLPPSKDAEQGTRLHECMEKGTTPTDADEAGAVEWCRQMETTLTLELFPVTDEEREVIRERRLWDREHSFSGKADVIYLQGERALILDYKFGRNPVAPPTQNWQLAALAVLVVDNFPQVREVFAGILQPYASMQKPQLVNFVGYCFETARRHIAAAIANAQPSWAPVRAGEQQCRYCRAAAACPAVSRNVQTLVVTDFAKWELMTPEQKAELWQAWKKCEKAGEKLAALIRNDLRAGVAIPGLYLTAGSKKFEVTDPGKAFALLAGELGITGEEFTQLCKVGITALDKLVHKKRKEANPSVTQEDSRLFLRTRLSEWNCGQESASEGSIKAKNGGAA